MKALSKRTRFEVFKRDSFKCQYCGKSAPEVVLHVDHIKPRAEGGTNDILNLITSCVDCNLGKGAVPLSDRAAMTKRKAQLDELQERREQLEMLMEWQEGLSDIEGETIDRIADFWSQLCPGYHLNANGLASVRKLLSRYSAGELLEGMRAATAYYLQTDSDGNPTQDSVQLAFNKIKGCCDVKRGEKDDPDLRDLLYVRAIVRNNCNWYDPRLCMDWLRAARSWGVPAQRLKSAACSIRNWTQFSVAIDELISEYKGRQ